MENEGIERYLKDNGIKPSYIRVKVYEYLIKTYMQRMPQEEYVDNKNKYKKTGGI